MAKGTQAAIPELPKPRIPHLFTISQLPKIEERCQEIQGRLPAGMSSCAILLGAILEEYGSEQNRKILLGVHEAGRSTALTNSDLSLHVLTVWIYREIYRDNSDRSVERFSGMNAKYSGDPSDSNSPSTQQRPSDNTGGEASLQTLMQSPKDIPKLTHIMEPTELDISAKGKSARIDDTQVNISAAVSKLDFAEVTAMQRAEDDLVEVGQLRSYHSMVPATDRLVDQRIIDQYKSVSRDPADISPTTPSRQLSQDSLKGLRGLK